ncbi:hypothetical protein P7C73_g1265, partial [Tremellales sp. Uapishka_1]
MDHHLLVSELQSLIVESKRRHPDVKDAGERALEVLNAAPAGTIATDQAEALLAPITLGCKTKNAKCIGISISALQRLVSLGGVSTASLTELLQTLTLVANQAVDIQLKILQTLLSILTYCKDIHGEQLGDALLLCFKLQDSRVSVVSSTAAATLRQAVMLIFDRVTSDTAEPSIPLILPSEPEKVLVTPSAMDAFSVLSDLCLLTARSSSGSGSGFSLWSSTEKEKPRLLKLSSLQRTFGLELVESILSGYEEGVKKHPELLFLLRHSLNPLLVKLQGEKPSFPIALRVCRLVYLLIRSFTDQLPIQVETYITSLIRMGMGEGDQEDGSKRETTPPWLRVLALEIIRGIWSHFDHADGPKLFSKLISAMGHLLNEKPALLGIGTQMQGLGVPAVEAGSSTSVNAGYLDMGIGMVATAASVGVSTVSSFMGSGGGLGVIWLTSRIEQHDKSEAPIIPETYIYLLALQSLDAVAEGIYSSSAGSEDAISSAQGMAESAWPALLAALSYSIGTNLSDTLFAEVLSALQDFTIACGVLSLTTPRDAFLNTLGKYAVPPPVVSALQAYMESPQLQRSSSVMAADALGLGALGVGGSVTPPTLSDRNLVCLKSSIATATILQDSLDEAWHDVLEALQNANYMLAGKKVNMTRRPTASSSQILNTPGRLRSPNEPVEAKPEIFQDLDADTILAAINTLFDNSKKLEDDAFTTFLTAVCRLSSEMIGIDNQIEPEHPLSPSSSGILSPSADTHRRRTSGINISHNMKSGERSFGLSKLKVVASINLSRLVSRDPETGWTIITQHLLAVARHLTAPTTIRIQASETLSELLLAALRIGQGSRVQHQVFDVLVRQVDVYPISSTVATDYDVRSAGFQTLNQILESSGHSLEVGWQTIFGMLDSVCKETSMTPTVGMKRADSTLSIASTTRPSMFSKGDINLVRITFPSLQLICTDFLTSLNGESMRQCIACLGRFGRQREDVNITLAAIGLLWNVSDAVQGDSKDLWLYMLEELLGLGRDTRLEVRNSATQTLFRCVELYGAGLSIELWEKVIWKVIFPLLDSTQGDESQVLALTSIGGIFGNFWVPITKLPSFTDIFQHLLRQLHKTFVSDPRQCCTASLRALERILLTMTLDKDTAPDVTPLAIESTWTVFAEMGDSIPDGDPYTQENLLALVRVALQLKELVQWDEEKLNHLSAILRSVMMYSRSPEYRPDIDVMSPLQSAVSDLIATSSIHGPSLVLGSLAEFSSLAYMGDTNTKLTYIALSKYSMPKMREIFEKNVEDARLFEDGTVESVIGAYSIPIKLKYDCPAASKYGEDPPLWKTALNTIGRVLELALSGLDNKASSADHFEGIWAQAMDVFSGILLAERIIESYAEILRKASTLYHYDVRSIGGTTAPAVSESQERLRYWAFDLLIASAGRAEEEWVAKRAMPFVVQRFQGALQSVVEDSKLRGQIPFGRVREEELLYILRHLATMRVWGGSMTATIQESNALSTPLQDSTRSHLLLFYSLLLQISFLRTTLPTMWIFPSEYSVLFGQPLPEVENRDSFDEINIDAGDGGDLLEINARDIARRCLELIGEEMGLS